MLYTEEPEINVRVPTPSLSNHTSTISERVFTRAYASTPIRFQRGVHLDKKRLVEMALAKEREQSSESVRETQLNRAATV